jgi:hypothetical protein
MLRDCRLRTPVIAISSLQYWKTLRASPAREATPTHAQRLVCRYLAVLAGDPVPLLPLAVGFLTGAAISPSRIACLRASLRDRRTASAFSLEA